ncbi:MAG: hypothetical protein L7F78_20600, partial [Syntrophales bacterium LBB04]|nr:hypothetical protein [Syntrophales bacterium LBB04]
MLLIYNILLWVAALFLIPYYGCKMLFTGKYRKGFGQRFGLLPAGDLAAMKGSPRIWVHAVSVGEVTAAAPIIASLREQLPSACIMLSTTTETGQEMARRIVTAADAFIYYPLDLPFAVRRSMDRVRPDVFVLTETELWPNFIMHCRMGNVRVFMANGRLSPHSFRNYKLTRFFWKGILSVLDGVGTISAADAERFRLLGAPPDRLHVLGNAKYDSLAAKASSTLREEIGRRLNMRMEDRVLVAGSTHPGEEEIIFGVYAGLLKTHPDVKLIIVPRHIERSRVVLRLAREAGFEDVIAMTEMAGGRKRQGERVIIV